MERQRNETWRVARRGKRKGRARKCERLIDDRERLAIASPPRMEDKFIRCQWNAAEASRKKSTQHDAPPSASQSRFRCKFNRDDSRRSAVISRNYGDRVLNRRFVERSRSRSLPLPGPLVARPGHLMNREALETSSSAFRRAI